MQKRENVSAGDRINDFVQKNRKGIFVTFGVVIALFVVMIAYLYIGDYFNNKAAAEAEELNTRFTGLQYFINQGIEAEEVDILLSDLETYAHSKSIITEGKGFAQGKVWSLIGHIYSSKKNWEKAEEAWLNAARKGAKTYLSPIALFNAAVASEEQGKLEQAIDLLKQSIAHKIDFPSAPRAQFNIGRLYEQLGNYDEALTAYRAVLINWPNMPVFQYLARNQIVKIEVR